ncbi:hypothetical protein [Halovivax gelatinilyticus]|nr:hypothetical protein [Halovivax gelatinilyticus]
MGDLTAYCPQCDGEEPIRKTVPWQPNLCTTCGSDIEEDFVEQ